MKPPVAGQDFDVEVYGPIATVAAIFARSHWSIRGWVRAGAVRHRTDGATVLVHVLDAAREDEARPRRARNLKIDDP